MINNGYYSQEGHGPYELHRRLGWGDVSTLGFSLTAALTAPSVKSSPRPARSC
jgi:hypothetical protein